MPLAGLAHGVFAPHKQTSFPVQVHVRAEPQPGVPGWIVTLHSLGAHAAAGAQQVRLPAMLSQTSGVWHSLHIVLGGGVAVLHESGTCWHWFFGTLLQESVRVQQVPGVPAGGAMPGAPVALLTHSWLAPQATSTLFSPQPLGSDVPHWPAYEAGVFGVQHAPVLPGAGAGLLPPVWVQT